MRQGRRTSLATNPPRCDHCEYWHGFGSVREWGGCGRANEPNALMLVDMNYQLQTHEAFGCVEFKGKHGQKDTDYQRD